MGYHSLLCHYFNSVLQMVARFLTNQLGDRSILSKGGDNIKMNTLIRSSPTTLKWLNSIKSKIEGKIPSLKYGEKKFWATFKSPEKNRNVVMLQPQKSRFTL